MLSLILQLSPCNAENSSLIHSALSLGVSMAGPAAAQPPRSWHHQHPEELVSFRAQECASPITHRW